jgi:hypothetical protein
MARDGTKTGGKDFQIGNAGGPGKPKLPDDVKQARKLNKIEFERVLNEAIHLNGFEIKTRLSDPTTPAIEMLILKIIAMGINKGDERRLNFILDRLIGQVKTKVSIDGGEDNQPVGISIAIKERLKLLKGDESNNG